MANKVESDNASSRDVQRLHPPFHAAKKLKQNTQYPIMPLFTQKKQASLIRNRAEDQKTTQSLKSSNYKVSHICPFLIRHKNPDK